MPADAGDARLVDFEAQMAAMIQERRDSQTPERARSELEDNLGLRPKTLQYVSKLFGTTIVR